MYIRSYAPSLRFRRRAGSSVLVVLGTTVLFLKLYHFGDQCFRMVVSFLRFPRIFSANGLPTVLAPFFFGHVVKLKRTIPTSGEDGLFRMMLELHRGPRR